MGFDNKIMFFGNRDILLNILVVFIVGFFMLIFFLIVIFVILKRYVGCCEEGIDFVFGCGECLRWLEILIVMIMENILEFVDIVRFGDS